MKQTIQLNQHIQRTQERDRDRRQGGEDLFSMYEAALVIYVLNLSVVGKNLQKCNGRLKEMKGE